MSNRNRPPAVDPVNPAALIRGSRSASTPGWSPKTIPNTPGGRPAACTAWRASGASSTGRPGCDGWALTTTGQPLASAEAVSPPSTLKANGKLLAPKISTGPSGSSQRRRAGRGGGVRDAPQVAAVGHDRGKQPELAAGPGDLAGQPGERQPRFLRRQLAE